MTFIFDYELQDEDMICEWETEITEKQYDKIVKGIQKGKELLKIKGLGDMIRKVVEEIEAETGKTVTALDIGEVMVDELFMDDEIE